MTIAKGESWGTPLARPDGLRVAGSDAELARMLTDGSQEPTAVSAGDMFRTVGARPLAERTDLLAFPVDLVHVSLDGGDEIPVVAHLVARSHWMRGGVWRGPLLAVMNAEWIGDFDVAPRGHPNDGRVETLLASPALSLRHRWAVRSRLRNATHLPHPQIATRPVRTAEWTFERPLHVDADGASVGSATHVAIRIEPDAATLIA